MSVLHNFMNKFIVMTANVWLNVKILFYKIKKEKLILSVNNVKIFVI
jgi:hypothetical protein